MYEQFILMNLSRGICFPGLTENLITPCKEQQEPHLTEYVQTILNFIQKNIMNRNAKFTINRRLKFKLSYIK